MAKDICDSIALCFLTICSNDEAIRSTTVSFLNVKCAESDVTTIEMDESNNRRSKRVQEKCFQEKKMVH